MDSFLQACSPSSTPRSRRVLGLGPAPQLWHNPDFASNTPSLVAFYTSASHPSPRLDCASVDDKKCEIMAGFPTDDWSSQRLQCASPDPFITSDGVPPWSEPALSLVSQQIMMSSVLVVFLYSATPSHRGMHGMPQILSISECVNLQMH